MSDYTTYLQPLITHMVNEAVTDTYTASNIVTNVNNRLNANLTNMTDPNLIYCYACSITTQAIMESQAVKLNFVFAEGSDDNFPFENMFEDNENFIPENFLSNLALINIVEDVVSKLPYEYKIVMECYYCQGMSVTQIAERLGTNVRSIKIILKYLRDTLKYYISTDESSKNVNKTTFRNVSVFMGVLQKACGLGIVNVNLAGYAAIAAGSAAAGGVVAGNAAGQVAGATMATGGTAMSGGSAIGGAAMSGTAMGGVATGGTVMGGAAAGGAVAGGTAAATVGGAVAVKVGIVLGGAALAVGGGVGIYHVTKDKDDPEPTTEQVSDISEYDSTYELPDDFNPDDIVIPGLDTEEVTEEVTEVVTEEIIPDEINVDGTYVLTYMYSDGVAYEGAELNGVDSLFVVDGDEAYMTNGSDKEYCSFEIDENYNITIVDAINATFYGTYDQDAKIIILDIDGIIMEYTLETELGNTTNDSVYDEEVDGNYILTYMLAEGIEYVGDEVEAMGSSFLVEGDEAYMTVDGSVEHCTFELSEDNIITVVDDIGDTFYGIYYPEQSMISLNVNGIILKYTAEELVN